MKKKFIAYFILLISLFQSSCGNYFDGKYKLVDGNCQQFLTIRNVGGGKYSIILEDKVILTDKKDGNEILGILSDNIITGYAGVNPIHFVIMKNHVYLIYKNKKCKFEKDE